MGTWLRRAWRRLRNVTRWSALDAELRAEVEHHLEQAAASHVRRGLSVESARRQAVREFGGERWLESSRSTRGVGWLQDGVRDARQALRTAGRQRGFTLAVVLVMAVGVGATTAIYSVLRGVLLNPLPYASPEALYTLLEGDSAGALRLLSYPTFEEVAAAAGGAADLAYIRGDNLVVRGEAGTLNVLGAFVSANYFELMGEPARAGRTFGRDEADAVAVLSWRYALMVYGAARAALGATLTTATGSYTVVGVMPPGFAYPVWADMWLPLHAVPADGMFALQQRNLHVDSDAVVRLGPGSTLDEVRARLGAPIAQANDAYPEPGARFDRAVLSPLRERVLGADAPPYGLLVAAVAVVLLLASVNIAGLVLARGMARRSELATRVALGAGRARLARQLMTESLVLGVLGGAAGVLLAHLAVARLKESAPALLPRMEEIAVDGGVLLFAVGATLFSALLFGAFAAWRATAGAAAAAMRAASRTATGDRMTVRLRSGLVVVQIAFAVVLLVGASLLVRSAREHARLDLGFDPDPLIALRISPPEQYGDDTARLLLYESLRDAVARVPGVDRVALANHIPLTSGSMPTAVRTSREVGAEDNVNALYRAVSWDYLDTIGARPARGRLHTMADAHGTGVVVNQTLARREWGDADPIGEPLTVYRSAQGAAGFGEPLPSHVVGVIEDIREFGPDIDPVPAVYVPLERNVWTNIHLMVRTTAPPGALLPAMRAAVNAIDADIPTAGPHASNEFRSMNDYLGRATLSRRFGTALMTVFAAVAVVLALTGLFAVLAFSVAQRTREIGVRMALGARRHDAARLIVGQSVVLVCLGLAAGCAAAIPATRLLEANLFGIQRLDPLSFVMTAAVFIGTAVLAVYLPARRAARVDPMVALRAE